MKAFSIDLANGSQLSNAAIAFGSSFPANPEAGELFWKTGTDFGLYIYSTAWEQIGTLEYVPKAYNSVGGILSKPKIFTETVTSNSSGVFTVSLATAGFTQTPVVTATVITSTANAYNKPFATLTTVSSSTVTGTVIKGIQTILLAGTSVEFAGVQTISVIAIGK